MNVKGKNSKWRVKQLFKNYKQLLQQKESMYMVDGSTKLEVFHVISIIKQQVFQSGLKRAVEVKTESLQDNLASVKGAPQY